MDEIWIGSQADIRHGSEANEILAHVNDSKYWDNETGIIKVDRDRWKLAQTFESDGWLYHWVGVASDRNHEHEAGFNGYQDVPADLGNIIEIGCGPFTQLQTIARNRNIKSITLLDPLIDKYKSLQHCPYRKNKMLSHPVRTICSQAEELNEIEKFNAAICINVLEHVQDATKVLDNLYKCIVKGGIVIFGERSYDDIDINKIYDAGHPIRIKSNVFLEWEKQFTPLYCSTPQSTDPLGQDHYFIGIKR